MVILLLFSFLSGLVTILAPCIWPLLPIILSSTTTGGKKKPLGITLGIMTSFTVFTLSISTIVMFFHIDPDILRLIAVVIIGFLGLTLVIPKLSSVLETVVSKLTGIFSQGQNKPRSGFWGGYITGFSLGLVWSPCAGPILATIATIAATQKVTLSVVFITLAYVLGVGIPLLIFSYTGSVLFAKTRALSKYTARIQQIFGLVMILTAGAIYTNYDKTLQVKLLDLIPAYSNLLYGLEERPEVKKQLDELRGSRQTTPPKSTSAESGKTIMDILTPKYPKLGKAPEFSGIEKWISPPASGQAISLADLRGKVVLVDFWTYTCINCIRTLPHVTSWYEKYKDKGFIVIGVHTPEFEFEKKTENVRNAIKQYRINYPIAQDNNYRTWNSYENQYWPAKYLIDKDGYIRYTHFGEGKYEETEKAIQYLLSEAGNEVDKSTVDMPDETPRSRLTPETYLGSARSTNSDILKGKWKIDKEYAESSSTPLDSSEQLSRIEMDFYASKVFLVISPGHKGEQVKIYLDDKDLSKDYSGQDVNRGEYDNGVMELDTERLYHLVDLKGKYGNHKLKIIFGTGTRVFAFTFG